MLGTLLIIAILHWAALVTPGVNVLLIAQLAASGDRRGACYAALGITTVAVIWATLAIVGVQAVFAAHPMLRLALQAAGGAYLCWIAVRTWNSRAVAGEAHRAAMAPAAAYRLGFLTNITNPKSALFFGSVFVTALPAAPDMPLLVAAVALVFFNALTCHVLLALGFSHPRVQAAYGRKRRLLNRISGAVIGILGLLLFFAAAAEARSR